MKELTTRELKSTDGGISAGAIFAIVAGIIFIIGIIDGLVSL